MTKVKLMAGGLVGVLVVLLVALTSREGQAVDSTVARVSHVAGHLAVHNASETAATYVEQNAVVREGDTLWTDRSSQAEIELERGAWLRLAEQSKIELLSLGEKPELRLWNGSLYCQVRQTFGRPLWVRTPDGDVEVLAGSIVRVDLTQSGTTSVSVLLGSGGVVPLNGERILLRTGQRCSLEGGSLISSPAPFRQTELDPFDHYETKRINYLNRYSPPDHLESPLVGAYELYDRGTWVNHEGEDYWRPDQEPGWRPYSDGYWSHVEGEGLSWVDDEPWGYTTSHYGRWAYLDEEDGWCWKPDDEWAPAHVAWGEYEGGYEDDYEDNYIGWAPLDPYDRPCNGWDLSRPGWFGGDDYDFRRDDRSWSFARRDDFFYCRPGYDEGPRYYTAGQLDVEEVDVRRFRRVRDCYEDFGVPRYAGRGFAVAPDGYIARDTVLRVENRIPRRRLRLMESRFRTPGDRDYRLARIPSPLEAIQRYPERRLGEHDVLRGKEGARRFRSAEHRSRGFWRRGPNRNRRFASLESDPERQERFLRGTRREERSRLREVADNRDFGGRRLRSGERSMREERGSAGRDRRRTLRQDRGGRFNGRGRERLAVLRDGGERFDRGGRPDRNALRRQARADRPGFDRERRGRADVLRDGRRRNDTQRMVSLRPTRREMREGRRGDARRFASAGGESRRDRLQRLNRVGDERPRARRTAERRAGFGGSRPGGRVVARERRRDATRLLAQEHRRDRANRDSAERRRVRAHRREASRERREQRRYAALSGGNRVRRENRGGDRVRRETRRDRGRRQQALRISSGDAFRQERRARRQRSSGGDFGGWARRERASGGGERVRRRYTLAGDGGERHRSRRERSSGGDFGGSRVRWGGGDGGDGFRAHRDRGERRERRERREDGGGRRFRVENARGDGGGRFGGFRVNRDRGDRGGDRDNREHRGGDGGGRRERHGGGDGDRGGGRRRGRD